MENLRSIFGNTYKQDIIDTPLSENKETYYTKSKRYVIKNWIPISKYSSNILLLIIFIIFSLVSLAMLIYIAANAPQGASRLSYTFLIGITVVIFVSILILLFSGIGIVSGLLLMVNFALIYAIADIALSSIKEAKIWEESTVNGVGIGLLVINILALLGGLIFIINYIFWTNWNVGNKIEI
jgi:hypothetical protein